MRAVDEYMYTASNNSYSRQPSPQVFSKEQLIDIVKEYWTQSFLSVHGGIEYKWYGYVV